MESAQFGTFNLQSMEKQHTEKWHSIKCAENGSFKMWNVQTMKCANYRMSVSWIVQKMECAEYRLCKI
jgi:hypothetical protein